MCHQSVEIHVVFEQANSRPEIVEIHDVCGVNCVKIRISDQKNVGIHVFFEGSEHRSENVEIHIVFVDFQGREINVQNGVQTVEIHVLFE